MGALISLEAAARHRRKIARVALLGAAPRMPVHPALLAAAAEPGPRAAELICDWGFGPAGHLGGHKAPGSWMMGHGMRLLTRAAGPVLHTDLAACNAYQGGLAAAAKLRCPTLVLAGEFDRMTPSRHAAELAEALKGARFVALPACGHMMMVEQPDATLDALVEFVRLTEN
jgi:pimeloyl-ACP methyl ester carboxylesterase